MNKKIIGSISKSWAVQFKHDGEILGVFPSLTQANGFLNELNITKHAAEVVERNTFTYEGGNRVSFFDPRATHFVYELDIDYEPKNVTREKEIRAQALAKLTAEERKVLNL